MARVLTLTARTGHGADGRQGRAGRVSQAAVQRDEQLAGARVVSVFAQPDALPRAQVQLAFRYRDRERRAQETCFYVRRLKIIT